MLARCLICDRWGRVLAEPAAEVDWLRWRLNAPGQAVFRIPYADPACRPELLELGNRVAFCFDDGLPLWGGVLATPRRRDERGVELTALTGEALLDWRITDRALTLSQAMPGALAAALLRAENAAAPTGVEPGAFEQEGPRLSLALHYHDLLGRLRYLARLTGQDFVVAPRLAEGRLTFALDWRIRRGADRAGDVVLSEGGAVSRLTLAEEGMLANRVVVVGDGAGWGPERVVAIREDPASIARFGLREWAELHTSIVNAQTAEEAARVLLGRLAWPRARAVLRDVLDEPPAAFGAFDVGDVVTLEGLRGRGGWGYRADLRVVSRTWRGATGACDLELGWADWQEDPLPITDLSRALAPVQDAGTAGATEAAWLQVAVGGATGYLRLFSAP